MILGAGTFGSTGILLRSGVGPRAHLEKKKIKVICDLPVGHNWIEHSYVHLLFKCKFSKVKGDPVKGNMDAIIAYLLHNAGPFATLPYQSGHFNSENISWYPNYQRYFTSFPWGSPPWYKNFLEFFTVGALNATAEKINNEGDLLIVTHCMSQPKSRGYIKLAKCPNCKFVELHSNLLEDPYDRMVYVKAIRGTFELFKKQSFRDLGIEYVRYNIRECDEMEYDSDDYWDCIARYQSSCGSHPTGKEYFKTNNVAFRHIF